MSVNPTDINTKALLEGVKVVKIVRASKSYDVEATSYDEDAFTFEADKNYKLLVARVWSEGEGIAGNSVSVDIERADISKRDTIVSASNTNPSIDARDGTDFHEIYLKKGDKLHVHVHYESTSKTGAVITMKCELVLKEV